MQTVKNFILFPRNHVALAWWLALLFPLCWGTIRATVRRIPIWSEKYRQERLSIDIRILEGLHGNTYALTIYLAEKAVGVVLEIAYAALVAALMANRSSISLRWIVFVTGLSLASGVFGIAWRVRTVVRGLANYDDRMAKLKARQKPQPLSNRLNRP